MLTSSTPSPRSQRGKRRLLSTKLAAAEEQAASEKGHPLVRNALGIGVFVFLLFFACTLAVILLDQPPPPRSAEASALTFSAARAARHLAVISRAPHPINSLEHSAVRDYIVNTLRGLGYAPEVQRTTDVNARYHVPGALENILCRLKGSGKGNAILLDAHYDSVPAGPGASDDGAAVAALLETARILKILPVFKRDVIFFFSDGEEEGLLGARAFVAEHPWAHDVGIVLNFEARGNSGPSIMFETSDRNGWLIDNFAQAASHPVANSLSYEIYKRLPNNTDLTIFRRAGYAGMNFAYIDGIAYYHTLSDSFQNTDLGSLQHQGDYALELARQFGNTAAEDPHLSNLVYFDILGKVLVHYGPVAAGLLNALGFAMLACLLYLAFRQKRVWAPGLVIGFVGMFVGVTVTVLVAQAAATLGAAILAQFPAIGHGWQFHPGGYITAFCLVGLVCGAAFFVLMAKAIGLETLAVGNLFAWFGLSLAVNFWLPGGSFLCIWPLLFGIFPWLMTYALPGPVGLSRRVIEVFSVIPAIILLGGMAHKLFFAFAARSTLLVSGLLGLLLSLLISPIARDLLSYRRNNGFPAAGESM